MDLIENRDLVRAQENTAHEQDVFFLSRETACGDSDIPGGPDYTEAYIHISYVLFLMSYIFRVCTFISFGRVM